MRRVFASFITGPRAERGQVLPLFALFLVVLLGIAGLTIDVSRRYSEIRFDRSVADAASLAGAQDLQGPTRAVPAGAKQAARQHALDTLISQLGATGPGTCTPPNDTTDIVECLLPGTSVKVSIKTPAPSCTRQGTSTCDPLHAVQVTVHQTAFQTSFARVMGQKTWDFRTTSVAGLGFSAKYALMTLQAPDPRNNGTDANLNKDLIVNGNNTELRILTGDVGSNTSATTTNAGLITLQSGYYIDHYDDLTGIPITWSQDANGEPVGRLITEKIADPDYYYAQFTTATTFATQAAGVTPCAGADFPTGNPLLLPTTICYQPGIYSDNQGFKVGTGEIAYLMPGAYRFPMGGSITGSLYGGLIAGARGIVISLPESNTYTFKANNAENLLLNAGTCGLACSASPALDFAGTPTPVATPDGIPITIQVDRDEACFLNHIPRDNADGAGCNVTGNNTLRVGGNGTFGVGGIIYAPSDNIQVNGGSSTVNFVGQIVSWSTTYTGGATLSQSYPGQEGNGVLRLDPACTAPGEPCVGQ